MISSVNMTKPQETADLITLTTEILIGKIHVKLSNLEVYLGHSQNL